ncbi:MAG: Maf family protein [Casimicrobiaceae bacterium]
MTVSDPAVYLASRSPRRRELLRQIGVPFAELHLRDATGRERDVIEVAHDGEPPRHYVERIARTKAQVGWRRMQERGLAELPVLSADTEVVLDAVIYGKPHDAGAARTMLTRLSGRRHDVLTAVALRWQDDVEVALCVSHVTLRELSAREIDHYVATGEPFDKAGGYAIQGRAAAFVTHLEGSYSGVMGLPLAETAGLLARFGRAVL